MSQTLKGEPMYAIEMLRADGAYRRVRGLLYRYYDSALKALERITRGRNVSLRIRRCHG